MSTSSTEVTQARGSSRVWYFTASDQLLSYIVALSSLLVFVVRQVTETRLSCF